MSSPIVVEERVGPGVDDIDARSRRAAASPRDGVWRLLCEMVCGYLQWPVIPGPGDGATTCSRREDGDVMRWAGLGYEDAYVKLVLPKSWAGHGPVWPLQSSAPAG